MRKIFIITLLFSVFSLTSCSVIKPYEVDIQQGNVVDKKMLNELHLGMTKVQVEDLLGTPVLCQTFDDDDWSYVYTNQINGGAIEKRKLELQFAKEKLVKIKK